MLMPLLIFGIVAVSFVLLLIFKNKLGKDKVILLLKIFSVSLFVLVNFRSFLNDNFVWVINGGTYGSIYYKTSDVWHSILRWTLMLSYVAYPCAIFFKSKFLKNVSIYFCLPVNFIATFFYSDFLNYFITNSGRAIYASEWLRHLEFSFELILGMLFPLTLRFLAGYKFDVKNKSEWLTFFGLLPLCLLVVIPVTVPQSLFGFSSKYMVAFTLPHILWIVVILSMLVGLYFAFRFKDKNTRYALCTFLALFLFLHYNQIYLMDLNMKRLPFQLCNLGSYLVLFALLVKNQPFFDFVLLANVPGAMIAFLVPDISEGMLSYWNIHFYIEHTWVFIVPLLMVALRLYERPNKGTFKHFFVGFSFYFVFCAVIGILANCCMYKPFSWFFNRVNYFYLFDDTVINALPFLRFTRKYFITWNNYSFYPLYMLSVYILYSVFCLMCNYVFRQLCVVGDNHFKTRSYRIDMRNEQGKYKKRIPKKEYDD